MSLEHFTSFDGTRLAIHRAGAGRPVILLHGLFSSAHMNWIKWGHADRFAAAGFEAIMPDFRVHGESEAPQDPSRYPPGVLVRDVAALIDHLGLAEGEYDLCGFSLGARTSVHGCATGVFAPRRLVLAGMGVSGLADWKRRAGFFTRVIDEFDTITRDDPAWLSRQFLKSDLQGGRRARCDDRSDPRLQLAPGPVVVETCRVPGISGVLKNALCPNRRAAR